jgi:hypothetical protein
LSVFWQQEVTYVLTHKHQQLSSKQTANPEQKNLLVWASWNITWRRDTKEKVLVSKPELQNKLNSEPYNIFQGYSLVK